MAHQLAIWRPRQIKFPRNPPKWFHITYVTALCHAVMVIVLIACTTATAIEPFRRGHTRPARLTGIPWADYQYRARSPSETAVSRTAVLLRTRVSVEDVLQQDTVRWRRQYSDEQVLRRYPSTDERHIERRIDQTVLIPEDTRSQPFAGESRTGLLPPLPSDERAENRGSNVTRRSLAEGLTVVSPAPPPQQRTVVELYQLDRSRLQIDHCEISEVALQLYSDGRWILSLRADQNRRPGVDEPQQFNPQLHLKRNQFVVRLRCLGAFQNEPTEAAMAVGRPVLADLQPLPFWVENGRPYYLRAGDCDGWVAEHFAEIDRVEIEFYYFGQQGSLVTSSR